MIDQNLYKTPKGYFNDADLACVRQCSNEKTGCLSLTFRIPRGKIICVLPGTQVKQLQYIHEIYYVFKK
jgi:hypothetical protein